AEERDRNRKKREVVVHDDREDSREGEFGHQQRGGDERDACKMAFHLGRKSLLRYPAAQCSSAARSSLPLPSGRAPFRSRRTRRASPMAHLSRTHSRLRSTASAASCVTSCRRGRFTCG